MKPQKKNYRENRIFSIVPRKHLTYLLRHDNEAFGDERKGSIGQMIFFSVEGGNVALTDC